MSVKKNLHVPLPEKLYSRLREESERSGRPATSVAREAIDHWLTECERRAIHEAVATYARRNAGTEADLLPDVAAAGVEHLSSADGDEEAERATR